MKVLFLFVALSLSLCGNAYGQICGMPDYPYGFGMGKGLIMQGNEFKSTLNDLPFIDAENHRDTRYSEFWVEVDVLNVRSGPSLNHAIISETYFGNLVFAFAKKGNWVAIRRGGTLAGKEFLPRWVHIKYLSPNRIHEQVSSEVLKAKCGFAAHGTYLSKIDFSQDLANIYSTCGSVRNYLSHQQLLGTPHSFVREYGFWRVAQKNSDEYSAPSCLKS